MLDSTIDWNGLKILSPENDFYCLLYHCLTNKGYIADDYLPKLERYKRQFNIKKDDWNEILVDFLRQHNYDIVKHTDPSNPFNLSNPIIRQYALRYGGVCIQAKHMCYPDLEWTARVYEKENSFVKSGSVWMIQNEQRFLEQLCDYYYFPKLLGSGTDGEDAYIEISRIKGVTGDEYFEDTRHRSIAELKDVIGAVLPILKILQQYKIIHRDFIGQNIFIETSDKKITNVGLIDFGWAITTSESTTCVNPLGLGHIWVENNNWSDFVVFANYIRGLYGRMPYFKQIADELEKIELADYDNDEKVDKVLMNVQKILSTRPNAKTIYKFYRKKYSYLKEMSAKDIIASFTPKFLIRVYHKIKVRLHK